MFHGKKVNSKINHLQERICNDYIASFKIHNKNIQSLVIELFNVENEIANTILCDIFPLRCIDYNLRSQTDFFVSSVSTTQFVSE